MNGIRIRGVTDRSDVVIQAFGQEIKIAELRANGKIPSSWLRTLDGMVFIRAEHLAELRALLAVEGGACSFRIQT